MPAIPVAVGQAAKSSMSKWNVPASVSLAQWAIESGWGAHQPGNNPFGMKVRKGRLDLSQLLWTTEVIDGKTVRIQQSFRKFNSLEEAFEAHAELLATAPVYRKAMSCLPSGGCPTREAVNDFIDEMAKHYATDPLYSSKLKSTIEKNSLWRFDI